MYVARTFRISTVRIGYWFNNFVENPKSKTIENQKVKPLNAHVESTLKILFGAYSSQTVW